MSDEKKVQWTKVKVKAGHGALSHDGVTYVAHNGVTDVPAELAADEAFLKQHGCTVVEVEQPDN